MYYEGKEFDKSPGQRTLQLRNQDCSAPKPRSSQNTKVRAFPKITRPATRTKTTHDIALTCDTGNLANPIKALQIALQRLLHHHSNITIIRSRTSLSTFTGPRRRTRTAISSSPDPPVLRDRQVRPLRRDSPANETFLSSCTRLKLAGIPPDSEPLSRTSASLQIPSHPSWLRSIRARQAELQYTLILLPCRRLFRTSS